MQEKFYMFSDVDTVLRDLKRADIYQEQEQNEETIDVKNLSPKDSDHSNFFNNNSSTSTSSTVEIKNDIDIFLEDIKLGTGEEQSNENIGFCQVCHQNFGDETDIFKSTSFITECCCQNENEPLFYNLGGQDMTLDEKLPLLDSTTAVTPEPLEVQDETISEDDVNKEQGSSAEPQMLSGPSKKNYNEMKLKICLERLDTNLFLEKRKSQNRNYSKSFHQYKVDTGSTEKRRYCCKICSSAFKRSHHLKIHARVHTGEKPFQCKICLKSFAHSNTLRVHQVTHTGEKAFSCKICSKSFARMDNMKFHERSMHTYDNPYRCDHCSKSFGNASLLKVHRRIHTGEKSFQCKICSTFFRQMSQLKVHVKSHTGERPYSCKICSKSFSRSSDVIKHQVVHTGEKPFRCKICSKSFGQMVHKREHERSHTGEKPYTCKLCPKSYGQIGGLRYHEMRHSGSFDCNICSEAFTSMKLLKIHRMIHAERK